jgi:phospholipid-binding lipoprotein MlaA
VNRALRLSSLAVVTALTACSVAPPGTEVHDPYEAANRQIHDFNKGVDQALLRPASQVVNQVDPAFRERVSAFSDNVGLPGAVLNNILQGDIEGITKNTLRFVINSTVGVLGLFDPAGTIGIDEVETDFGETLAVWGIPEGAYVELPFFGPSTERDAVGRLVDIVIDPLDSVGSDPLSDYATASEVGDIIIDRGDFGDTIDSVLYESADSYAQSRLFYLQNRRFELGEAGGDAYVDPYGDAFVDPYADAVIDPYEATE